MLRVCSLNHWGIAAANFTNRDHTVKGPIDKAVEIGDFQISFIPVSVYKTTPVL